MNRRKLKGMFGRQKKLYDKYVRIIYEHPRNVRFSKNFTVRFIRLVECLTAYDYDLIMNEYKHVIHASDDTRFLYTGIIEAIKLIKKDKTKWSKNNAACKTYNRA